MSRDVRVSKQVPEKVFNSRRFSDTFDRAMSDEERAKTILAAVEEDLRFCEAAVANENRLELAVEILQEALAKLEEVLSSEGLPEEKLEAARQMQQRAKLLLHRAQAIIDMRDREQERFLPKRV